MTSRRLPSYIDSSWISPFSITFYGVVNPFRRIRTFTSSGVFRYREAEQPGVQRPQCRRIRTSKYSETRLSPFPYRAILLSQFEGSLEGSVVSRGDRVQRGSGERSCASRGGPYPQFGLLTNERIVFEGRGIVGAVSTASLSRPHVAK